MTGFSWPQWLFIAWMFFILLNSAANDGKPYKPPNDQHRFGMALLRVVLLVTLLYWGKFFG